jgi:hypothetical protein
MTTRIHKNLDCDNHLFRALYTAWIDHFLYNYSSNPQGVFWAIGRTEGDKHFVN